MAGTLDGQAAKVRMHVALGYQGDMEIELIEDLGAGPPPTAARPGSRWWACITSPGSAMMSLADVARGTARGMQVKFQAANEVTRVAYLADPREPKLLFEFIEMNEVDACRFCRPTGGRAHLAGGKSPAGHRSWRLSSKEHS